MAAKGPGIGAFSATWFTPSYARKGCRNADMRIIFPGMSKKQDFNLKYGEPVGERG